MPQFMWKHKQQGPLSQNDVLQEDKFISLISIDNNGV